MSTFSFGFQVEDDVNQDPTTRLDLKEKSIAVGDGNLAKASVSSSFSPQDVVGRDGPPHPPSKPAERNAFSWISSSELRELWIQRRQRDIYCKTLDGLVVGGDHNDASDVSSTQSLRHVVFPRQQEQEQLDLDGCREDDQQQPTIDLGENGSVIESGVYEGGGAVWECSMDLVKYFLESQQLHSSPILQRQKNIVDIDTTTTSTTNSRLFVLELGCGHALPSCCLLQQALQQHTQDVCFALVDYNRSVVESVTLPNLILNTTGLVEDVSEITHRHVVLGAGDWWDMSHQLLSPSQVEREEHLLDDRLLPSDGLFDVILAAETLYTPQAAHDTAQLIKKHLRKDGGIALIASKRYYFGVGGGVEDFRLALLSSDNDNNPYDVETVRIIDTGVANIREIVQVKYRGLT